MLIPDPKTPHRSAPARTGRGGACGGGAAPHAKPVALPAAVRPEPERKTLLVRPRETPQGYGAVGAGGGASGSGTNGLGATATGMTAFGGAATGFVAGATAATGFSGGALVIAVLAVGLRAGDLATLALLADAFVAEAALATDFLGGALVIAALAVGLRAGDLATLALLAGAFVAGARFAAIVCADFFAADFFVVFFAAATFFMFFAFFAIIVSPIVAAEFPNHTRQSNPISSGCNGTVRLSTQLRPVDCVGPADLSPLPLARLHRDG
jgi:hypothetical protein